ncbi:nuclear transport factor 2 family protein [Achromobacter sp. NPDC008082]|jgi:ketosteroid isomerase-like protein|uniref:nuclear transport factor 2 family protein n=1 Tax=Achromobacter sp. NPDC008082 TaxID=3363888 RepID=UPI0036EC354F
MMTQTITARIQAAEEELRQAMLASDIAALSRLLDPGLLFTNHMGWTFTREDDLEAHRSGLLKIHGLDLSEWNIAVREACAVVSVQARITGSYNGVPANGTFRFMRTWAPDAEQNQWRVIAASSVMVV